MIVRGLHHNYWQQYSVPRENIPFFYQIACHTLTFIGASVTRNCGSGVLSVSYFFLLVNFVNGWQSKNFFYVCMTAI